MDWEKADDPKTKVSIEQKPSKGRKTKRRVLVVILVVIVLAIAGNVANCGGSSSKESAGKQSATTTTTSTSSKASSDKEAEKARRAKARRTSHPNRKAIQTQPRAAHLSREAILPMQLPTALPLLSKRRWMITSLS